jgi:hypothetical protein
MDALNLVTDVSFGQRHFGACDLGDARLLSRAVKTADLILRHPGGTLPEKLNHNADIVGLYRFANNPKVTHQKLLAGHFALTRQKMQQCGGTVLILHDTTEEDFTGLESVEDLGPIGNGGGRGFLCHNSLAVRFQDRSVLGLASQILHTRRKVRKREEAQKRRSDPQRESRLWPRGLEAIVPAPAGTNWIHVTDRGGDTFEFIDRCEQRGEKYIVRSKHNRMLELQPAGSPQPQGKPAGQTRLHDYAAQLPATLTRDLHVQANGQQTPRKTKVQIAWSKVTIQCPAGHRGEHREAPLHSCVIQVREINPPKEVTPLLWTLLSNSKVENDQDAAVCVDQYQCRPIVEEFHKAMKTGCGVELPQFTTRHALEVTTALLSVVAVALLNLRDLSRREDAQSIPATEAIDAVYVNVLSVWRFKTCRPDLSVKEFCGALAKLGGHFNRKHDHPPGWLVLWRGWTQLQLLVEGALGAKEARCV